MAGTIRSSLFRRSLSALALFFFVACSFSAAPGTADLILLNGAVYTLDPLYPWASAVAVSGGKITFVGNDEDALAQAGPDTTVIKLEGRMVLPGFHDSHMHPMAAGTRFLRCQLDNRSWPEGVLKQLEQCAGDLGPGGWLRGIGLANRTLENPEPDKALLDPFTSDIPAFIELGEVNSFWVNSHALQLAGIDETTPNPSHGAIERRAGSDVPSGVLRGEAVSPVYKLIPPVSAMDLRKALKLASEMANRFGITSANEAAARPEHIEVYLEAEAAGEMSLRIQASLAWDTHKDSTQIGQMVANHNRARGVYFTASSVKLFLDGDLYWKSAALLQPYVGMDDTGKLNYTDVDLASVVRELDEQGLDLHMHAYGDGAVRQGLDAIALAIGKNPPRDRRPQIAHLALIDPADLGRFSRLGVTADIQPLWHWLSEERMAEAANLGPERASHMMPASSLFASGSKVVSGSDWVSDSMNPLLAIQIAITRRPPDGRGPAWNPEQRATLEQMLTAYTINGAWLARQEKETGSIETGKAADLIVLEQNLFNVNPMKVKDVRVLLTLLEGREVYRDPDY